MIPSHARLWIPNHGIAVIQLIYNPPDARYGAIFSVINLPG